MDILRTEIDRLLGEAPEHNRVDEHQRLLEKIMQKVDQHRPRATQ